MIRNVGRTDTKNDTFLTLLQFNWVFMPDEYQDSFVVSSNVENLSNDQIDSDTACSDLKCKAEQISCKL